MAKYMKLKKQANTFAQHEICRRKSLLWIKNFNDVERECDEPISGVTPKQGFWRFAAHHYVVEAGFRHQH